MKLATEQLSGSDESVFRDDLADYFYFMVSIIFCMHCSILLHFSIYSIKWLEVTQKCVYFLIVLVYDCKRSSVIHISSK